MLNRLLLILAALILNFLPLASLAVDMDGSKDHPRVPRLPNYEIVDYVASDFGSHDFVTSAEDSTTVEGKIWRIDYQIEEGAKGKGALEVARNYTEALKAKGGTIYEEGVDISGGRSFAWMKEENGAELWLEVEVSNHGEYYILTIVEKEPLKLAVEIGANEIVDALKDKGSIALYGILFDTDKSDIKPESQKTIDAIAEALYSAPELKVEISGHTDNVGDADYNQKLSEARAKSVMQALVAKGISTERLQAVGYGLAKPVESNDTDEGRAKNRRVELTRRD